MSAVAPKRTSVHFTTAKQIRVSWKNGRQIVMAMHTPDICSSVMSSPIDTRR
jgi:hypothetical protein